MAPRKNGSRRKRHSRRRVRRGDGRCRTSATGAIAQSLTIAGAFKPFQEIDVHAKVAGYIKTIYVDVGTHVKEGQTLAILEVPELKAELAGADAAVRRLATGNSAGTGRCGACEVWTLRDARNVQTVGRGIPRKGRAGGSTGAR